MPVFSMIKRKITVESGQKLTKVARIGPANTMGQILAIPIPPHFMYRGNPSTSTFKIYGTPDGRRVSLANCIMTCSAGVYDQNTTSTHPTLLTSRLKKIEDVIQHTSKIFTVLMSPLLDDTDFTSMSSFQALTSA